MRNFTLLALMICWSVFSYGQGHETFDNFSSSGTAYSDGSFTGQDGGSWNYLQSRGDAQAEIEDDNPAIMLGKNKESELTSPSFSNGIGTLEFTYMQAFSTDANLEVYVNNQLVYTATSSNQQGVALSTGTIPINVNGSFTLRFYNPSGAGQVNIDDIIWTATSSNPSISILTPTPDQEFAPGTTPELSFSVANFTLSSSATANDGDGYIQYEIDDNPFTNYFSTDPISLNNLSAGEHSIIISLINNSALTLIDADTVEFTTLANTLVNTVAELRQGELGHYYTLDGEAILSYQQNFRHQKYVQDATGGILIDDNSGVITTVYNRYDGISGLTGKLIENNGVLQLQPTEDPGTASSTENFIVPEVITIADLMANPSAYESEIIALENVSFTDADGTITFDVGTNYDLTDGADTTTMRTNFYDADYIGSIIPQGNQAAVVGIAAQFNGDGQFYIRDADDLAGTPLGLESNKFSPKISLYPNPATEVVTLELQGQAQIAIYSVLGQLVRSVNTSGLTKLDISDLSSGLYFVQITKNQQSFTQKLIIN